MSDRAEYYIRETGYGYAVCLYNKVIREFLTEEEADEFKNTVRGFTVSKQPGCQEDKREDLIFYEPWELVEYLTTTIAPLTDNQVFVLRKVKRIGNTDCHEFIRCKTKTLATCSSWDVVNDNCWVDVEVVRCDDESVRVLPMKIRQMF